MHGKEIKTCAKGRILDNVNGVYSVIIEPVTSAHCGGCAMSGLCGRTKHTEVIVKAKAVGNPEFCDGEEVFLKPSGGLKSRAIIFLFVAPLLILIFSSILFTESGLNEIGAALISLILSASTYLLIYLLCRKHGGKWEILCC